MRTFLGKALAIIGDEPPKNYEWHELGFRLAVLSVCIYVLVTVDAAIYNYLVS